MDKMHMEDKRNGIYWILSILCLSLFFVTACGGNKEESEISEISREIDSETKGESSRETDPKVQESVMTYTQITMAEAFELFKTEGDYLIVDVRRADEFAAGHIPGAIHIANESIGEVPPEELPDKDQLIYIYCRSGNRSKQAAAKLVAMGYTNLVEFGGIIDWPGEIEQ